MLSVLKQGIKGKRDRNENIRIYSQKDFTAAQQKIAQYMNVNLRLTGWPLDRKNREFF